MEHDTGIAFNGNIGFSGRVAPRLSWPPVTTHWDLGCSGMGEVDATFELDGGRGGAGGGRRREGATHVRDQRRVRIELVAAPDQHGRRVVALRLLIVQSGFIGKVVSRFRLNSPIFCF